MVASEQGESFMPKDTFLNLANEKRKKVEDAAIDEFAEYGFENASINRIVENSEIAKGSFYQYFSDKKDLFLHIIQLIGQEKMKYLSDTLRNPQKHDFFTLLKELYASGLKFATSNVKLANIGNQLIKNVNSPIYQELLGENLPASYKIYEELLKLAVQRGEVREDIDIVYVSYMLVTLAVANFEYWLETNNHDFDIGKHTESIMKLVDKQLDFLKNGIEKKEGD